MSRAGTELGPSWGTASWHTALPGGAAGGCSPRSAMAKPGSARPAWGARLLTPSVIPGAPGQTPVAVATAPEPVPRHCPRSRGESRAQRCHRRPRAQQGPEGHSEGSGEGQQLPGPHVVLDSPLGQAQGPDHAHHTQLRKGLSGSGVGVFLTLTLSTTRRLLWPRGQACPALHLWVFSQKTGARASSGPTLALRPAALRTQPGTASAHG